MVFPRCEVSVMVFPAVIFHRYGSPRCAIPRGGISRVCFPAVEVSHQSIHREFFRGRVVRRLLLPEKSSTM